ncbi:MAG: ribonuclease D, partial [Bacteroidales bacterium]|nr:ribonuclease D [Bacteroidales bacterium]
MQLKYITTSPELNESLNHLINVPSFAIDLEFDKNRYAYGFNLCLVQIYSGEYCYLIDPLAKDLDIGLLFPLLENEKIQKVVLSFGEDLRLLHSLGCFPKNLFDLALASRLLNHPPGSLAVLLGEVLQIGINKSSQNSNGLKRPLTEKQLNYAAKDVVHLLKLQSLLVDEAREKKVLSWIEEENAGLDKLSFADVENNNFIKNKDKSG